MASDSEHPEASNPRISIELPLELERSHASSTAWLLRSLHSAMEMTSSSTVNVAACATVGTARQRRKTSEEREAERRRGRADMLRPYRSEARQHFAAVTECYRDGAAGSVTVMVVPAPRVLLASSGARTRSSSTPAVARPASPSSLEATARHSRHGSTCAVGRECRALVEPARAAARGAPATSRAASPGSRRPRSRTSDRDGERAAIPSASCLMAPGRQEFAMLMFAPEEGTPSACIAGAPGGVPQPRGLARSVGLTY